MFGVYLSDSSYLPYRSDCCASWFHSDCIGHILFGFMCIEKCRSLFPLNRNWMQCIANRLWRIFSLWPTTKGLVICINQYFCCLLLYSKSVESHTISFSIYNIWAFLIHLCDFLLCISIRYIQNRYWSYIARWSFNRILCVFNYVHLIYWTVISRSNQNKPEWQQCNIEAVR